MLGEAELTDVLLRVSPTAFSGLAYRAVDLEALYGFHRPEPFAQPLPLFATGASRTGARFTPVDGPPTLYVALDPATALAEANRVHTRIWGASVTESSPLPPTVLISEQLRLDAILDVTDTAVQQAIHTTIAELLRPWRRAQFRGEPVVTQFLGRSVFGSGRFQAIRYASAMSPNGQCLAVFPERLEHPAFVEVVDPHANLLQRLP